MKLLLKWFDSELALAFIEQQPFFSTIIGATTLEQLKKTLTQLM
jgi:aryl-alcohol dehydrogenase-like predicted oxidoreductase